MYNKKQRIAALIGIILLCCLYLFTLICAIFNFDGAGRLFMASLFATIAVPLLIWIYIWIYGKINDEHTIASFVTKEQHDTLKKIKEEQAAAKGQSEKTVTLSKRKKS